MAGIITSVPPLVQRPPGNASSNPAGLPGVTYTFALLQYAQTWTAKQTFPLGNISLNAADIIGLAAALATTFQPIENVDQEITAGATANVGATSFTVRVNKAVGGAITLTLPLAIAKTVPVLIADWKGDASINSITINPSGTEKIQGLSSWIIAADNGSIFLRPIPGVGYAI
jgi:hypothetical protein